MSKQIQAVATDLHQAILEQPASVRSPITFVFSQRSWLMTLSQRDGGYQVTVSVCLGTVPIAGALAVRRQQLLAQLTGLTGEEKRQLRADDDGLLWLRDKVWLPHRPNFAEIVHAAIVLALLNQGIVEQVAPYCQDGHI